MKILVISASFPPMRSGGADYAYRLCQELAEAGMRVQVVTSCIENVAADPRIQVYPIMRRWSWSEMPRVLKMAWNYRPDVINLHFVGNIYNNHPMITLLLPVLKRLLPRARVVTHIEYPQGIRPICLRRRSRVAQKLLVHGFGKKNLDGEYGAILRDSDRIILLSDTHRAALSEHFADVSRKCVLIPPPVIMPRCKEPRDVARRHGRAALSVAPDEWLIAYYGYIYPAKGIETLLAAFQLITQRRQDVRLVLIGGSNEVTLKQEGRPYYVQELHDLTERLGIEGRVLWTGYYPADSDCASCYLTSADVGVLPFDRGVFMNNSSFAAAVAHGLPVVTTKGEVIETQFKDRENVLLCPPENPEAIASAVDMILDDKELRERLEAGALEMAEEWFSWDKAVKRTLEAFAASD